MAALTMFKALDQLDRPIAGAKLEVWPAGASPKTDQNYAPLFSDAALTVALSVPVVSDETGQFGAVFFAAGSYDLKLTDAQNRPLFEVNGAVLS